MSLSEKTFSLFQPKAQDQNVDDNELKVKTETLLHIRIAKGNGLSFQKVKGTLRYVHTMKYYSPVKRNEPMDIENRG